MKEASYMSTISSSALAAVQARRFSAHTKINMRRHGGGHAIGYGGRRASLYKQIYGNGARNGVKIMIDLYKLIYYLFIYILGNKYQ